MHGVRRLPAILLALVSMAMAGFLTAGHSFAQQRQRLTSVGVIFAGVDNGHLYRSADGGQTWQESDKGLPGDRVNAVTIAPDRGNTLYAGTDGSGVFVSTDAGQSWRDANGHDGPANAAIVGVAIDRHDARRVIAADIQYNSYSTVDGGRTWLSAWLPNVEPHGDYSWEQPTSIAVDSLRPATALLGTTGAGVFASFDSGANWDQQGELYQESVSMLASARDSSAIYIATSDGLYKTLDDGRTGAWLKGGLPLNQEFTAVAVNPRDDHQIITVADNGIFYHSSDGGTIWKAGMALKSGKVTSLVFDPSHPFRAIAGLDNGNLLTSTDSGASWTQTSPQFTDNAAFSLASGPVAALPSDPVPAPGNLTGLRYFSITRHAVRDPFLAFWDRNGNTSILGLPLTEAFTEGGQTVQYFERARLALAGSHVVVSPLGVIFTSGRPFPQVPSFTSTATRLYFPSTGHSLSAPFLAYWQAGRRAGAFGPPISEPLREQNGDGSGRAYLVQYFRNARLEYHLELAGTRYAVQAGLLGRQYLHQRGWI